MKDMLIVDWMWVRGGGMGVFKMGVEWDLLVYGNSFWVMVFGLVRVGVVVAESIHRAPTKSNC